MANQTKFTVEGRGEFPLDMLRYDRCYPLDGDSVSSISNEDRGTRRVTLVKTEVKILPTTGRWASFGWYVDPDSVEDY